MKSRDSRIWSTFLWGKALRPNQRQLQDGGGGRKVSTKAGAAWLSVTSTESSLNRSIYLFAFISPPDGKGMSFGKEGGIRELLESQKKQLLDVVHLTSSAIVLRFLRLRNWNSVETLVALGLVVAATAVTTSRWIYVLLEKSSKRDKRWRLSGALKSSELPVGLDKTCH